MRELPRAFFGKPGPAHPPIGTVKLTIGDQPRDVARLHAPPRGEVGRHAPRRRVEQHHNRRFRGEDFQRQERGVGDPRGRCRRR